MLDLEIVQSQVSLDAPSVGRQGFSSLLLAAFLQFTTLADHRYTGRMSRTNPAALVKSYSDPAEIDADMEVLNDNPTTALNGAISAGATTLIVDNANGIDAGGILRLTAGGAEESVIVDTVAYAATALSGGVLAAQPVLPVDSIVGFSEGDTVLIDPGEVDEEKKIILSIDAGTLEITLTTNLGAVHNSGSIVRLSTITLVDPTTLSHLDNAVVVAPYSAVIPAHVGRELKAAFAQSPRPAVVKLGKLTSQTGDLATQLSAIEAEDAEFYGMGSIPRRNAAGQTDVLDAALWAETRTLLFCAQDDESEIRDTAYSTSPAATDTGSKLKLLGYERTRLDFHAAKVRMTRPNTTTLVYVEDTSPFYEGQRVILATASQTPSAGTEAWVTAIDADAGTITCIKFTDGTALSASTWSSTSYVHVREPEAFALAANRLAYDPDQTATIWQQVTLPGITPQRYTAAEQAVMKGKNANFYTTAGGLGATAYGKQVDGTFTDLILSRDWVDARMREALLQVMADAVNAGSKIPFDETGFARLRGVMLRALKVGEQVGHFVAGTSEVVFPKLTDVDPADRAARIVRAQWGTQPAGAIQEIRITGSISISFTSLAS